jgi:hypothetical protein
LHNPLLLLLPTDWVGLLACAAAAEVAVHKAGGVAALLTQAGVLHLQQQQQQQQKHHPESTAALNSKIITSISSSSYASAPPQDTSGPEFKWGVGDVVVFPLEAYEAVVAGLQAPRPPLLGHGSCVPEVTLAAYRCVEGRLLMMPVMVVVVQQFGERTKQNGVVCSLTCRQSFAWCLQGDCMSNK